MCFFALGEKNKYSRFAEVLHVQCIHKFHKTLYKHEKCLLENLGLLPYGRVTCCSRGNTILPIQNTDHKTDFYQEYRVRYLILV